MNKVLQRIKLSVNTYGTTINTAKFNIYFTTDGIKFNNNEKLEDLKWKLIDSTNTVIGSGNFSDGKANTQVLANKIPIPVITNAKNEELATKTFILFIYAENKNKSQNEFKDINFTATLSATVQQ